MDRRNRLNGSVKAALTVALVLGMTGALILLAAEKGTAEEPGQGFLGVSVRDLSDDERVELGVKHGVRVAVVEKESAAAKAGIAKGDVIQTINGEKVRDSRVLTDIVRELPPGSTARVGLWRDGKALEVKAVLGKLERMKRFRWQGVPLAKSMRSGPYLGVGIMDLADEDLASYFAVKAGEGVLVTGVEIDTPAAKAGLKPGDVIVQVGNRAVKGSDDIHEALAGLKKGDSVGIVVVRHAKRETFKAAPDFERHRRVVRIFSGGKDMEIEHLELPELDVELPELDIEIPAPPDVDRVMLRVHEGLERVRERLEHARDRMERSTVRVKEHLKKIAENYWI